MESVKTVTPKNKYDYWQWLRTKHHHYSRLFDDPRPESFAEWITDWYGIKVSMHADGYGPTFDVIDEKKYLMLVLEEKVWV